MGQGQVGLGCRCQQFHVFIGLDVRCGRVWSLAEDQLAGGGRESIGLEKLPVEVVTLEAVLNFCRSWES